MLVKLRGQNFFVFSICCQKSLSLISKGRGKFRDGREEEEGKRRERMYRVLVNGFKDIKSIRC